MPENESLRWDGQEHGRADYGKAAARGLVAGVAGTAATIAAAAATGAVAGSVVPGPGTVVGAIAGLAFIWLKARWTTSTA
ncbi:hypothetical protein ACIBF1_19305 [Spirillospora sp. NPDC050679]